MFASAIRARSCSCCECGVAERANDVRVAAGTPKGCLLGLGMQMVFVVVFALISGCCWLVAPGAMLAFACLQH